MITHSVFFKLKHPKGSAEEKTFLNAAIELSSIPGVNNFQCVQKVGKSNKFDYGLTMEFDDQKSYDEYSAHPDHVQFVEQLWLKNVDDFLEIDYVQYIE
ncbi:Dabb family protein [Dyadobacter subterraneus]|uniref:Dabb family protein n=1 Tax=Dyadobacter subterraneus TaxID=2773304 RepID=A0ABR9WD47_9BACT|nr:Dabb family protein [Dyadobacter subterraneus]MBE9463409.1 Dabb family protein [Dyadobacter subterraneus]